MFSYYRLSQETFYKVFIATNHPNATTDMLGLSHSLTPQAPSHPQPWHEASNNWTHDSPTSSLQGLLSQVHPNTLLLRLVLYAGSSCCSPFKWLLPRKQSWTTTVSLCKLFHSQGSDTLTSTGLQARKLRVLDLSSLSISHTWESFITLQSCLIFISHETVHRQSWKWPWDITYYMPFALVDRRISKTRMWETLFFRKVSFTEPMV